MNCVIFFNEVPLSLSLTHVKKIDFPPVFRFDPQTFLAKPDRTKKRKKPPHEFLLIQLERSGNKFLRSRATRLPSDASQDVKACRARATSLSGKGVGDFLRMNVS
jgi:hypothetical protein